MKKKKSKSIPKQKSKKLKARKRSVVRRKGKHERSLKKAKELCQLEDRALVQMAEEAKIEPETSFPSDVA